MILSLSGGFHNSPEVKVRVSNSTYRAYSLGQIEFHEMLTDYQDKKLSKHFCGVKGCTCGSYMRAEIEASY